MTRSIVCEPVSPLSNPTSLSFGAPTTIAASSRYVVRATATSSGQTLAGRTGMSNRIENEGAFDIGIFPVGSPSFSLQPGAFCVLTWDNSQSKHEVQQGLVVDAAMSTTSTNPVQNKIVKAAIDSIVAGTAPTVAVAALNTFVSGDIGKPVQGAGIYSPFVADPDPRGLLYSITNASEFRLVVIGGSIDIPIALCDAGLAVGDLLDWDGTKYVNSAAVGTSSGAPPLARVSKITGSVVNAVVLVG